MHIDQRFAVQLASVDTVLVNESVEFGRTDTRVGHGVFTRAPAMGVLMIVVLHGMSPFGSIGMIVIERERMSDQASIPIDFKMVI